VQLGLAAFVAIYLWQLPAHSYLKFPEEAKPVASNLISVLMLPFYKYPIHCGVVVGLIVTILAIMGSSNAVNLTDGLDGLAIGCTLITATVFLIFTYVAGNFRAAAYLQVPYVEGAGELTVLCALGIVAVLIHQPFVLVIAGGVFVMEAASVILQKGWFRYTRKKFGEGRRIFLMAPIHHHFEKKGWYESQVVTRFYILCVLFAVVALASLKIR
jgi:phospho-N-acetylmuramoyl-pentapeptide-transferase